MADTSPWSLTLDRAERDRSVYLALEAVRVSGIFLQAFIPDKAGEMLDMLGVDPSRRTLADARLGADYEYGVPSVSLGTKRAGLFPPLAVED